MDVCELNDERELTPIARSIQRKKNRIKEFELDLCGMPLFITKETIRQEINSLKHEISEDEKLLSTERSMIQKVYRAALVNPKRVVGHDLYCSCAECDNMKITEPSEYFQTKYRQK